MAWKSNSAEYEMLQTRLKTLNKAVDSQKEYLSFVETSFGEAFKVCQQHSEEMERLYPDAGDGLKPFIRQTAESIRRVAQDASRRKDTEDPKDYSRIRLEWKKYSSHFTALDKLYKNVEKAKYAHHKAKTAFEKYDGQSKKDPKERDRLEAEYNKQRVQDERTTGECLKAMYLVDAQAKAVLRAGVVAIYLCEDLFVDSAMKELAEQISFAKDNQAAYTALDLKSLTAANSPKSEIPSKSGSSVAEKSPRSVVDDVESQEVEDPSDSFVKLRDHFENPDEPQKPSESFEQTKKKFEKKKGGKAAKTK
eukprot:CAMPEP_0184683432 /NCGR_PEP_ID=MMETSP0312-20130426/11335_1 /TAXON_ID=31354 /ORGANISM="Compsopogon coeruleus, Strain SAG 36.94" /LENGTH=306 /DNA_ID=CAMNT_0027135795 /DNA_START=256 /DNA_END=1176 /DNA_ORIENTATION=+